MEFEHEEWAPKLHAMKLKRLYQLSEMSKLQQPIGDERGTSIYPPGSSHPINFRRSKKRADLDWKIREHIDHIYEVVHNARADSPWFTKETGGYVVSFLIWDHWQPDFKCLVAKHFSPEMPWPPSEKDPLWDDSTDEEL
jgi:hypothetical protein